jgi:hypothetical protein
MKAKVRNATPVLMTIGLDIGKDVFHLVGFDAMGKLGFGAKSSGWLLSITSIILMLVPQLSAMMFRGTSPSMAREM